MRILKRNQIIIYSSVLMLMVAGYFNYTENVKKASVETSIDIESKSDEKLADIGDATLVNSSDIIEEKDKEHEQDIETNTQVDEYFAKTKLERDTMYSETIETYDDILDSTNATEEQKKEVVKEIAKINDIKNKIMISENLLETKGFTNSVILVNEKSVNVVLDAEKLETKQVAQIQNIISREMDSKIEDIHISTK